MKPGPEIGPAGRAEDATLCRYLTRPAIVSVAIRIWALQDNFSRRSSSIIAGRVR